MGFGVYAYERSSERNQESFLSFNADIRSGWNMIKSAELQAVDKHVGEHAAIVLKSRLSDDNGQRVVDSYIIHCSCLSFLELTLCKRLLALEELEPETLRSTRA